MNVKAADAATNIPAAVDRGREKACRCTEDPGVAVAVRDAVQAVAHVVEPRAAMSERPS
jgi:hypothetical protein